MSQAGFKGQFVRPAILPEWWSEDCAKDPDLLPEFEVRVARFLEVPLSKVRDPGAELTPPGYPHAHLRRVRDLERGRLAPAIHAALQIGAAVVRSLRSPPPTLSVLPSEALAWRGHLQKKNGAVELDNIIGDLWLRGIPVVPLDVLPVPSFQGIACILEGRPLILLGHRHDEPGRVAFHVAHEAGHIAKGDCAPDQPVIDEQEEIRDETEMERAADQYATRLLVGKDDVPKVDAKNYKELASRSAEIENETGADAGMTIFAWAARTGDYAQASMAVKALYRGSGARRLLRKHFELQVDLQSASESDRALLRCVAGSSEYDETPG